MVSILYLFEKHPAAKGTCPNCGKLKSFRYYENLPREYGICERKNSCGFHNKPEGIAQLIVPEVHVKNLIKTIFPDEALCASIRENHTSLFHIKVNEKLKIPYDYLHKWSIGSRRNETAFIYTDKNNKPLNIRFLVYNEDCKRDKNRSPYTLPSKVKGEKYSFCLFGEHILSPDKIICLVESEKTAFIASYFYPEFDWLATGSSNGLTVDKIPVLFNRQVYYLADADKVGRNNSSIKMLHDYKINFQVIDLFPSREDGFDIADAIIENHHPEIKPNENRSKIRQVKQVAGAKASHFERAEKLITDEYELRYNEVASEFECMQKNIDKKYQTMKENNIYRYLQHNYAKISLSNLAALLRSDFVPVYNPFSDFFENLAPWDSNTEPDYINKISEYVIAKEPERFIVQLKKHLVRCVACALLEGYFNKHAFILVHDIQSSGKSTFCRWLCPSALSEYIAENITTDKDGLIALGENFLINLDELATMNKTDINSLKSSFSKDKIKARRPFDRRATIAPRRASFFGSTDRTEFLTDEAGSVRWLCFELAEKINWNYKNDLNVNDIWRQAYTLYKSGFKCELTAAEIQENENVNKSFRVLSTELELVQKIFEPGTKEQHDYFHTATDVLNVLHENYPHLKTNHVMVGKALKTLGYLKGEQRTTNVYPIKGYYMKLK